LGKTDLKGFLPANLEKKVQCSSVMLQHSLRPTKHYLL